MADPAEDEKLQRLLGHGNCNSLVRANLANTKGMLESVGTNHTSQQAFDV